MFRAAECCSSRKNAGHNRFKDERQTGRGASRATVYSRLGSYGFLTAAVSIASTNATAHGGFKRNTPKEKIAVTVVNRH
jgi:hypothetical protein